MFLVIKLLGKQRQKIFIFRQTKVMKSNKRNVREIQDVNGFVAPYCKLYAEGLSLFLGIFGGSSWVW